MDELTVADPPRGKAQKAKTPPPNPGYKSADDLDEKPGFALERATLDQGPVVLRWPEGLSADSVRA